jgi:hypothetical protein
LFSVLDACKFLGEKKLGSYSLIYLLISRTIHMRVKELIELLQTFPQEYEIEVYDIFDGSFTSINPRQFVIKNTEELCKIVTFQV